MENNKTNAIRSKYSPANGLNKLLNFIISSVKKAKIRSLFIIIYIILLIAYSQFNVMIPALMVCFVSQLCVLIIGWIIDGIKTKIEPVIDYDKISRAIYNIINPIPKLLTIIYIPAVIVLGEIIVKADNQLIILGAISLGITIAISLLFWIFSILKLKERMGKGLNSFIKKRNPLSRFLNWLVLKNKKYGLEWWIMIIGIIIILFMVFIALFPESIAPYSPLDQDAGPQLSPPSPEYPMGTDNLKRDVFSRVIHGSRTILGIAFVAAILSALIGIPLGLISGFFGGAVDRVLSLIMDSLYSFPGLILAIAFAAMLSGDIIVIPLLTPGVINITLAVAVIYIPTYFRLVRGQTLTIKEEVYVEAARAIGAKKSVILAKYIFPNVIATVVVVFSLNIADAIMTEAALSYIGLGLQGGVADWGMDLSMGKKYLPSGIWWMITYPGVMIVLVALGFTMLGEGLAEILNPRLLEK